MLRNGVGDWCIEAGGVVSSLFAILVRFSEDAKEID